MSDKTPGPQALYFDSNILRKAGWPDPSARLLEVVGKATEAGIPPSLVDLVRRELESGWIRDMVRDRRSLVEKGKDFARRGLGLVKVQEPSRLPSNEEMREHLGGVTEKFSKRFRSVPTTERPTAHFIDLALSRGGAFVEGGKGFNDTVILVSIIEDMQRNGFHSAILLSEDRGFQNDGMRQVTGDLDLRVFSSIEDVDGFLDGLVSARVRAYIESRKQTLIGAITDRRQELEEFLRRNLALSREDLGTVETLRKVEFVGIVAFEDAHSAPFILGQENREDNRLSVDVKIKVRLETETFLFERRLQRFDASPLVVHPDEIMISNLEKEVVVTVEGGAELTKEGIQAIHFNRVYAKKERGLASLLSGLSQKP